MEVMELEMGLGTVYEKRDVEFIDLSERGGHFQPALLFYKLLHFQ